MLSNNWIRSNGMIINEGKTKAMLVGSRQKIKDANISGEQLDISINDKQISCVTSEKILGLTLDSLISWDKHIDNLCLTLSRRVGLLRRLCNFIPSHLRKVLYYGLIQSAIDYCSIVWGNTTSKNIDKVYKMQKRALRVILNADFDTPTEVLFERFRVLSVRQRIFYFTCIMVYKCFSNTAPSYLIEKIVTLNDVHTYQTRGASTCKLLLPRFRTETGQRSFAMRAARAWNSLPDEVRCSTNMNNFKSQLNSYIRNNVSR